MSLYDLLVAMQGCMGNAPSREDPRFQMAKKFAEHHSGKTFYTIDVASKMNVSYNQARHLIQIMRDNKMAEILPYKHGYKGVYRSLL